MKIKQKLSFHLLYDNGIGVHCLPIYSIETLGHMTSSYEIF